MGTSTKEHSGRRLRAVVFGLVLVVALLALAAPSFADPGRAGLTNASQAVYPNSGNAGGVLGASGGLSVGQTSVPGGGGLPFTGFLAPLVLLTGLIALVLGLTLRIVSGRLTNRP
jgi:hypothetical protein